MYLSISTIREIQIGREWARKVTRLGGTAFFESGLLQNIEIGTTSYHFQGTRATRVDSGDKIKSIEDVRVLVQLINSMPSVKAASIAFPSSSDDLIMLLTQLRAIETLDVQRIPLSRSDLETILRELPKLTILKIDGQSHPVTIIDEIPLGGKIRLDYPDLD